MCSFGILVCRRGVTGGRSWTSRDRPDATRGKSVFDQPRAVGIGVVRHGATQHTVVERSAAVLAACRACELSKEQKFNHLNQASCSSRSTNRSAPCWPGQHFSAWLTQPETAGAGPHRGVQQHRWAGRSAPRSVQPIGGRPLPHRGCHHGAKRRLGAAGSGGAGTRPGALRLPER